MPLRRKRRVWKFLLAFIFLATILWQYRGNSPEFLEKALPRENIMNPIHKALMFVSDNLISGAHTCLSFADRIKITANFTINEILDGMKLTFLLTGLKADTTLKRDVAVADDVAGLDAADLEIIVIPHSHNDPGWKKTYMKYYEDDTRHILDLIVEKMDVYTDMTFVWVESCFLNTWWTNQTMATRTKFRKFVESGRLELVSGMWVAPDEASPHYFALVDQLIEGHYWVRTNIGVLPQTSLNFDQFGYSASLPYLMKASGLQNVLIKRIHRGLKQILGENKWMTFNWRQLWDPEGEHDILTQVDTYEWMSISDSCGPDRAVCRGLDFSVMPDLPKPDSPEAMQPIVYDLSTRAQAANLHDFVQKVVQQFKLKSANYAHKVMLLPHGGDFYYSKPDSWKRQYQNMKVFMKYVNDHAEEFHVKMRFGTFRDYFFELEKQVSRYGIKYPVVSGDFFTYTEGNEYWTGYFTTRQFDKRLSREVLESLRAAELMSAILFLDPSARDLVTNETRKAVLANLVRARQDLGIFQHHDAITGTSREHVAKDYEVRLSSAFSDTQTALTSVVEMLLGQEGASGANLKPLLVRTGYDKLTERITLKITTEGTQLIMLNSFTQPRNEIISIAMDTKEVIVRDDAGNVVEFDYISESKTLHTIMFPAYFPGISLKVYTITLLKSNGEGRGGTDVSDLSSQKEDLVCENIHLNVSFSRMTGSPEKVCYKSANFCSRLEVDWRYYKGQGGAYTMISNGVDTAASDALPSVKAVRGKTTCEVTATFTYHTVVHTVYRTEGVSGRALKVTIHSDLSKAPVGFNGDLAMRVRTDIASNNTFYVDSNGMQFMGRTFRKTLPFDANVYPMTAMSFIEDDRARLVVHSAQPHGVTSRYSGVLDFMIDRIALRPEMDMPEPVKDNKPTKTMLYIELQSAAEFQRLKTRETALPSLNSVFLNDIIQHPIYSFISHEKIPESQHSTVFLNRPLSGDVVLANVKNLAREDLESDGVSLTLFRRAVSCSKQADNDVINVHEHAEINIDSLLCRTPDCDVTVREMFLSTLKEKDNGRFSGKIDLKPMDIKTFHIKQKPVKIA